MPLWSPDNAALVQLQCRFGYLLMLLWCRHNAALVPLIKVLWCRHNAALVS
jgi:hypothetical protein